MSPAERYGLSDHACWAYDTDSERAAAATAWLADGLTLGQRAMYVADAPVEVLTDDLAGVPGRDEAIATGALVVADSSDVYDLSAPIDAEAQLAIYSAAVEQAITDGFAGIRVASDMTSLLADPARRRAHLYWEQYADRYMTEQPLAPLCMYDRRKIKDFPAIDHIHPLAGPTERPFSLYAIGPRQSALAGEVDALTVAPLSEALNSLPDGDDAIVASALRFVDAHGAWVLQQALERRQAAGRPLVLHDAPPLVRRVWATCGFDPALLQS